MKKSTRSTVVLALVVMMTGALGFAETGEATYKAKCQSCHGSTGTPNPGIAKAMGVKAATEYKASEKEQIEAVTNGKGKMPAFKGKVTDDQIKGAVTFFRTLK
jgi:mono/diheme cytochrome c family protein